jgi:hypothetical protein
MNCPACGAAASPEAFVCECGHALDGVPTIERPSEEIDLAWRQMLAGFWSIAWPSLIALPLMLDLFRVRMGDVGGSAADLRIYVLWQLLFYGGQIIFVPRLVRKNYSTWNLSIARDNGQRSRHLLFSETYRISVWIVSFQLVFALIATFLLRQWPDTAMNYSSLLGILPLLVFGPYSVGLAVRVKHRGFRLLAHGYRVGTLR